MACDAKHPQPLSSHECCLTNRSLHSDSQITHRIDLNREFQIRQFFITKTLNNTTTQLNVTNCLQLDLFARNETKKFSQSSKHFPMVHVAGFGIDVPRIILVGVKTVDGTGVGNNMENWPNTYINVKKFTS